MTKLPLELPAIGRGPKSKFFDTNPDKYTRRTQGEIYHASDDVPSTEKALNCGPARVLTEPGISGWFHITLLWEYFPNYMMAACACSSS